MATDRSRAIAEQLTGVVQAFDGVHGVFPERPGITTVLALVTPGSAGAPAGVRVVADEPTRVAARIAVARRTPSRAIVEAIAAAAADVAGRPCAVDIEIAAID